MGDCAQKMTIMNLEEDHLEGLRTLRNADDVRNWFFDDAFIAPEQQMDWYQGFITDPSRLMWVAVDEDGAVWGAAGLSKIDLAAGTGEFGQFMVAGPARNNGLARQLLRHALTHARDLGLETVWLEVRFDNVRAINLYRDFGFEEVRPESPDVITMRVGLWTR